jgi:uncharacterized protein (TIGR00369 family)
MPSLSLPESGHQMEKNNQSLVERVFYDAQFIRYLGIELASCGNGWCETKMKVSPSLRQQHGYVHAGALTTLADHTCGGAAVTTVPQGHDVITVENKVSFPRPASGSEVFCRAEVLRAGRTLIFVEAEVMVEAETGRVMVAKASSTLAIIPLRARPSS